MVRKTNDILDSLDNEIWDSFNELWNIRLDVLRKF